MSDYQTTSAFDNVMQKPQLPQSLNILTILTFVGCAVQMIGTIASPFLMKFSTEMMDKALQNAEDLPVSKIDEINKAKHLMELTSQNMVPIMIIAIIGITACFIGALMMRKLKKDGYLVYVVGEILPLIGNFVLLGAAQFADWKSYIGLVVPAVFILLYTLQRKHLVN